MKLRSLIVATVVLAALVGALYWSGRSKPAGETAKASTDAPPAILKLDQASITKLELKNKDAPPIVLEKNNSGAWQITQPKPLGADQGVVSGTLSALSALNSERLVEDKASDLKLFGLDQPAVEAEITEKGKTQRLLIGDDTPAGSAVYAMLAGDPRVFIIGTYTKNNIDKSLNDLRDKRLLTLSVDKVSRLELDRKNQEIEFGRDKDEWQVLKPKPLRADNTQVSELVRKLTDARMDLTGVAADNGAAADDKDAASAFTHATPVATAKLTDQSGTQEIQIRRGNDKDKSKNQDKSNDTYYAKSSVVDGVYKVDSDLGQAVDKGLDDFRNKKLFDFGFTDPTKVEMHSGAKAYFLMRGDKSNNEDWWSNGKKMDADSVETLVSDLRDLAATKFVESGFANPTIEVTVASNDGKRVEKVSLAKSGNGYIAKRENDTSLYWLDSNPIDALQKAADDLKPAAPPKK